MAMTQLGLLFIGCLATLATLGLFVEVADRWTQAAIVFLAFVLWGLFGMSSFDVIVRDTSFASSSEPIEPLVFLGLGMALVVGLYGLYAIVGGIVEEGREADVDLFP